MSTPEMHLVWPRCPKCGRRWRAAHPECGTEVGQREGKPLEALGAPSIEGLSFERLLGRGGFGEVFLARRASDDKRVAVKVPTAEPDPIMRLEIEGETLRRLGGTNAPALYDMPRLADGRPVLVMEFVPLPTLSDRMSQLEKGMPADEVARRGRALLSALKAVHALGLVHRDLKPENVFSSDDPPITRIFDFGLVKMPSDTVRQDTAVGMFMGTPEYMAPEQLDSSAPVDQRADIYAIGAVLYEMVTGRPPFWGNAAEVTQALANRRAPRPSRYVATAPALEEVILRCLAKDPVRRFSSTEELEKAFDEAVVQAVPAPVAAPSESAPAKPAAAPGGARRPMAVLAVQGVAVDVLMKALAAGGGQLAEVGRGGGVGVFGERTSENPVGRALRVADALLARKACRSAIVDLASVAVRKKPDGGERFVSAAFARLQKQLESIKAEGAFLTSAAGDLVPERRGEKLADGALMAALPPPRQDDALTVVRSSQSPLVGRDEEMGRLLAASRSAFFERRAGLATVIGEGGLGKSHLCAGLVDELRQAVGTAAIIELRVREPIDGDADGNLRALLGRCFTLPAAKPEDRGQALLGELGPTLWPAAALALGWMTPDEPELRALGAAPGVLRATVSRSVGEALRLRARERPLAVILDDAHFADDATLEAIEYATMPDCDAPLWICVVARPGLAKMKPSWGERSGADLRIELGPLGAEAATELARRLLYPLEHIPAVALETLVSGTHGSPFLLTELVRGLKRDGIVRRDAKSGIWLLAADELANLPDLAVTDWLAEREIGALAPELAAHARLSALLGPDFSEGEVEGIVAELERSSAVGGPPLDSDLQLDAHVATRQLIGMGVLKRQRDGRAAFRHTLLRAAVEKSVSDGLRASVHAAAFRFYRSAGDLEDSVRLPRLAFHAASAGYGREAAPVFLVLAERAAKRHRYVEAETLYSRTLGQLPEAELRPRMIALRGRGFMRYRMSRHDAVDDLMAALETAKRLEDRQAEIEIVLEAATALDWIVEYRRSRDLVTQAETLFEALPTEGRSELLRASLLAGKGRVLWRFSEQMPAIAKLQEASAIAETLGEDAYEIRVISLLLLGVLLPFHGQVAQAEQVFETVLSLCEGHGDRAHLMVAYLNRRDLWIGRRNLERALEDSRRSIQLAHEIGFVVASFMGEYNLAELLYQAGTPDEAWQHLRRAVDLEERRLSGMKRPVARLLEARMLTFLGKDAEARALFESISASQAELERTSEAEALFLPSEKVMLSLIDLCTRDASETEWKELRTRADGASGEQELIEVVELTALARGRRGQPAEARAGLLEALAIAERIPNVMEPRLRAELARIDAATPAARTG